MGILFLKSTGDLSTRVVTEKYYSFNNSNNRNGSCINTYLQVFTLCPASCN